MYLIVFDSCIFMGRSNIHQSEQKANLICFWVYYLKVPKRVGVCFKSFRSAATSYLFVNGNKNVTQKMPPY